MDLQSIKPTKTLVMAGWVALALGVALFLWRAAHAIPLFEFGDESEKYVAAQLIRAGGHLYGDIFAHHGPLPYMLAHAYAVLVNAQDFSAARWIMPIFALLAAISLWHSPAFRDARGLGALAAGLFLALLSTLWVAGSMQMLLYQPMAGLLLVVIFAQAWLPALTGHRIAIGNAAWAGFASTLACFCAYAMGPAVVLLAVASFIAAGRAAWRVLAKGYGLGAVCALVIVIGWLFAFGNLGGYLVYHFYFNQAIYAPYAFMYPGGTMALFTMSLAPKGMAHTLAMFALYLGIALLAWRVARGWQRWTALALGLVAVFATNVRGEPGFTEGTLTVAALALLATGLTLAMTHGALQLAAASSSGAVPRGSALLVVVAVLVLGLFEAGSRRVVNSPHEVARKDWGTQRYALAPTSDPEIDAIHAATLPSERILAYAFNPTLYLRAARLPASGVFYYLPWQADYLKRPVAGHGYDICADIRRNRPPVIWFDNGKVWNIWPFDSFAPCVSPLLAEGYVKSPVSNLFVRKDRASGGAAGAPAVRESRPSPPLAANAPIALRLAPGLSNPGKRVVSVGVQFGTYMRSNPGDAVFVLRGQGRTQLERDFALPALVDNRYAWFDVPAAVYKGGEVRARSGGGVSAWESVDAAGDAWSCVAFNFEDGTRATTPGCTTP